MAYSAPKVQKVMVQPINVIFRFLQSRTRVSIWIREAINKRFEGVIVGFDEYMNLVLHDAEEINIRLQKRHKIGKILLRGETITLIQHASQEGGEGSSEPNLVSA